MKANNQGDIFPEILRSQSPLVINARGARGDKKLTGLEGHKPCIYASEAWKAYNGYFDELKPKRCWPLKKHTRSLGKVVIANGPSLLSPNPTRTNK